MTTSTIARDTPSVEDWSDHWTLDVRSSSERADILRCWQELELRVGFRGLSCSFDWTESWLNAYGDLVPHRFLVAKNVSTETIEGVCLVTEGVGQKEGPLPIRTLHVGPAGEPDADSVCIEYNRLLVNPDHEATFARQIADFLDSQTGYDQWNLDGFSASDLECFEQAESTLIKRVEPAYGFDFARARAESSDVLQQLKSATRRKVKRNLEAFKSLETRWVNDLNPAIDTFGEMVRLHQARWNAAGKPGSYSSERFVAFHEELLTRLVPQGRLAFVHVLSEGETVGIVQLFIEHNRAMLYQNGWSQYDDKRSPGVVVDYLAMEECLKQGLDAYDFLAFATQHKRHLSNMSTDIVWARKRNSWLKFAVVDAARQLKRRLRRSK